MTDSAIAPVIPPGVTGESRDRAMNSIVSLAEAASALTFHHMPGDPAHVQYMRKPDGTVERVEAAPAPRALMLNRVADIATLVKRRLREVVTEDRMVIFVNENAVDVVFDTSNGRERAIMPLPASTEFLFFLARRTGPAVGVQAFRLALDYDLRLTFDDKSLVDKVGQLKALSQTNSQQSSTRGRESLGSVVVAEVAPAELPPPEVVFNVRMWAHADTDVRFPIACGLEPDPNSQQWMVRPFEDYLVAFKAQQIARLANSIREAIKVEESDVLVYEGTYKQA